MSISQMNVVRQAQLLMKTGGASIDADGRWGTYTQAAYARLGAVAKAAVDSLLTAYGYTAQRLRDNRTVEKRGARANPGLPVFISRVDAEAILESVAARTGVAQHVPALKEFLRREASPMRENGVAGYDVASRSPGKGSSKGLFQMQKAAWTDAQALDPSIGGYENVYDAHRNIAAGVAYARINIRQMTKAGIPLTANNLYLAHNQGFGVFSGARTAVEKQSREVQKMIANVGK